MSPQPTPQVAPRRTGERTVYRVGGQTPLPGRMAPIVRRLYRARNDLRRAVRGLHFSLDGKLIGDIGEAVATQHFGLERLPEGTKGHDFRVAGGRLVQVKATQLGAPPLRTKPTVPVETKAVGPRFSP